MILKISAVAIPFLAAMTMAMTMAMPADMATSDAREGFKQLDACLRKAAKSIPRDTNAAELNENDRKVISHILARSNCPKPGQANGQKGDTQGRIPMTGLTRTFLSSSSACSTCNTTAIDLQTMEGQDMVNGKIAACVLNADSACCACMLKYIAGNYFDALTNFFPSTSSTTTEEVLNEPPTVPAPALSAA